MDSCCWSTGSEAAVGTRHTSLARFLTSCSTSRAAALRLSYSLSPMPRRMTGVSSESRLVRRHLSCVALPLRR